MEIEINASEYSTPAKLAGAVQEKISQLYVDWVWVNFSVSRQKVTPNTAEHVCKGLLMADELRLKWADKKPDAIGWWWEWTGDISDAPEVVCVVSLDPLLGFYRCENEKAPLDGGPFYAGPIPIP